MVVDYILRYLGATGKQISEAILKEAGDRFQKRLFTQFMTDYETKVGGYGVSRATKCARANGYYHAGVPQTPMEPEVKFKLWYGDLCEIGVLALAQLAYEGTPHSIGLNNEFVPIPIGPGELDSKDPAKAKPEIKGFIDGMVNFNWSYHVDKHGGDPPEFLKTTNEDLLLEVKSMGSYPFDLFCKDGPDDTWGYLGQVSAEQRALRLRRYVMIAVDRDRGKMAEYVGTYNKVFTEKADGIYAQVMDAKARGTVPDIPPENAPVMKSGNLALGVVCSYCGWRERCWDDAGYAMGVEYVKGKNGMRPVFLVSKRANGQRNQPQQNERSAFGR